MSDYTESIWKSYLSDILSASANTSEDKKPEDIEDDMELLNLLKGYLVQCAEKILDNPEELVKEVLKARDEEIKNLKKEIEDLKKEVEDLKRDSLPIGVPYPSPLEPNPWVTTTSPWLINPTSTLPLGSDISYTSTNSNTNEAKR